MTLKELREGDWAQVIRIRGRGPFRRRLMEMGFIPGALVFVQKYAPLKDPIEFVIMGYHVSLRIAEADLVEVTTDLIPPEHFERRRGFRRGRGRSRRNRRWIKE
jgi:Fe2+ transport system protein FeoA